MSDQLTAISAPRRDGRLQGPAETESLRFWVVLGRAAAALSCEGRTVVAARLFRRVATNENVTCGAIIGLLMVSFSQRAFSLKKVNNAEQDWRRTCGVDGRLGGMDTRPC